MRELNKQELEQVAGGVTFSKSSYVKVKWHRRCRWHLQFGAVFLKHVTITETLANSSSLSLLANPFC
jgi:hypothetical protein